MIHAWNTFWFGEIYRGGCDRWFYCGLTVENIGYDIGYRLNGAPSEVVFHVDTEQKAANLVEVLTRYCADLDDFTGIGMIPRVDTPSWVAR